MIHCQCQNKDYPLAIDCKPVFTFQVDGFRPKTIRAVVFEGSDQGKLIWDSGFVCLEEYLFICDAALKERTRYAYYIEAMDSFDVVEKSQTSYFETSWFQNPLPAAEWMGADCESPLFFTHFEVEEMQDARLYWSALGFAQVYLNGVKINDCELSPVYSDYHHRNLEKLSYPIQDDFSYSHYYTCDDVTALLTQGTNTLTFWLGNGWYRQEEHLVEGDLSYGKPCVKCSLICGDQVISSGDCFHWVASPITRTNLYCGEDFDGRLWNKDLLLGTKDGNAVCIYPPIDSVLRSQFCPNDKVIRTITPVLLREENGVRLYDTGENISGRVRITTCAPRDTQISMQFAEAQLDGQLDFRSTSGLCAAEIDRYLSNGEQDQTFAPRFCIHGFRYFTVNGPITDAICEVIHTDLPQIGSFVTSNDTINQITQAYLKAQLTNFHYGVPSDCPHRERLGYTGDGQLTADTACCFFDMESFYSKWLRDIADCQCLKSGHVQHTAPFQGGGGGPGGWGGAMVLLPWKLYLHYGRRSFLTDYYPQMLHWMTYLESRCDDHIVCREEPQGWCLGDWCNPDKVEISESYVNTAYYIMQLKIMSEICTILGEEKQSAVFLEQYAVVQAAFKNTFYDAALDRYDHGTQGADVFAYLAGLMPRQEAQQKLQAYRTNALDTGIFGTPFLIEALCDLNLADIAVDLLTRKEYPSFGYMLDHGATTLWENFEGNASQNHPMFGAAIGGLLRGLLGIKHRANQAGFHYIKLHPRFPKNLQFVKITLHTPYGPLYFDWKRGKDAVYLTVALPMGTSGLLKLPDSSYDLQGGEMLTVGTDWVVTDDMEDLLCR